MAHNKCLLLNIHYLNILHIEPMKFGNQEDQLMFLLDTKFTRGYIFLNKMVE